MHWAGRQAAVTRFSHVQASDEAIILEIPSFLDGRMRGNIEAQSAFHFSTDKYRPTQLT